MIACSQDINNELDSFVNQTSITVGIPETRTSLGKKDGNNYPIYWSEGDKIVANGVVSTSSEISSNKTSAVFRFDGTTLTPPYHITYPYSEGSLCSAERTTVVFAEEQQFIEGTFDLGCAPMCGYYTGGKTATLKHLSGVLQIPVKGSAKLSKIDIIANEGIALAGEFDVDCQTSSITAIEGKTTNKITYIVNQTLSTSTAKVFHIAIPSGNLGICQVILTDDSEAKMELRWDASDVKPGIVREFKELTYKGGAILNLDCMGSQSDDFMPFDMPEPSNYELVYTSSDEKIVELYQTMGFSANVVSNTYHNGYGVIVFDKEISAIGEYAFYQCSTLTGIRIPQSVTKIRDYAFYSTSLSKIDIPADVTEIGDYAFYYTDLTTLVIPDKVTSLGSYSFKGCVNLTNAIIGNGVVSIGSYAFQSCSLLTILTIGNNVTTIGTYAFGSCKNLINVNIPDSVETVESGAFSSCGLTSATIGNSVTTIHKYAFDSCLQLTSIYCKPLPPPAIYYYSSSNYGTFEKNTNLKIYVPRNSYENYTQYSSGSGSQYNVNQSNWYYYRGFIEPYDF